MGQVPLDVKRMRVRQAAEMGVEEHRSLPREAAELPPDRSWRYRRHGLPHLFAVFGVVVGFAALVVPGVVAIRSYRRWRNETKAEPTFAWSMGVLGLLAIPLVPLFAVLPIVAIGLAPLVGLPLLILVGPRH